MQYLFLSILFFFQHCDSNFPYPKIKLDELKVLLIKMNNDNKLFMGDYGYNNTDDTILIYVDPRFLVLDDTVFRLPGSNQIILVTTSEKKKFQSLYIFNDLIIIYNNHKYYMEGIEDDEWSYYYLYFRHKSHFDTGGSARLLKTKHNLYVEDYRFNNLSSEY